MNKQYVQTDAPWETLAQYSRAIQVGNTIEVAGTTAMNGETVVGRGDVAEQARYILTKIEDCLQQLGASRLDVFRTRLYVTNIDDWEAIGRVHGEFFEGVRPVSTMVEVARLIHPELLIEIEVSAIAASQSW